MARDTDLRASWVVGLFWLLPGCPQAWLYMSESWGAPGRESSVATWQLLQQECGLGTLSVSTVPVTLQVVVVWRLGTCWLPTVRPRTVSNLHV